MSGIHLFRGTILATRSSTKHTCIREVRMKPCRLCALKGKRGGGGGKGASPRGRERSTGDEDLSEEGTMVVTST